MTRRRTAALASILLLAAQIAWFWQAAIEDAYISFRYARNWAQGMELVFNPGQRVEGYTNFSWTLLLGLAQRAGFDPIPVSKMLGVAATAGAVAIIVAAARKRISGQSATPALLLATASTSLAFWSTAGLETTLYLLLISLSLALYGIRRNHASLHGLRRLQSPWLYALPLALASLTRPEALGLAVLLVGWQGVRGDKKSAGKATALYLLIFLPFLGWRWHYYGDLIPNSLRAKGGFLLAMRTQPDRFWLLARGYLGNWALKWGLLWWLPLAWAGRKHAQAAPWLIAMGYTLLVATLGAGDWMPLQRLMLPLLAPWLWLALAGWERLRRQRRWLAHALLALLVLSQLDVAALRYLSHDDRPLDAWWAQMMPALAEIAHDAETPLATTVLGRTGYYFPGPVLDAFGLSNAVIARQGQPVLRLGRNDWAYVMARKPVFLLINDPQTALRQRLAGEQSYFWLPLATPAQFPVLLLVRADKAAAAAGRWGVALRPADDPAMVETLARRQRQRQRQALGPLYSHYCQPARGQCQTWWLLLKP